MPPDFHATPCDAGTQVKLEIIEDYLTEWLPVFLSLKGIGRIYIYDWFLQGVRGVKQPSLSKWHINNFGWADPVGGDASLDEFFAYRTRTIESL